MKVFILYLGFGNLLHVGGNIIQLQTEFTFLLLKLLFHSLKVVNLLAEVSYTVCLLLPQCGSGGLMLQSGLFKVSAQLLELSLPLLVHLNLGSSGTSSLLQPLTDLLQLSGQVCPLLLNFGPGSSLSLQLLFQLLNSGLFSRKHEFAQMIFPNVYSVFLLIVSSLPEVPSVSFGAVLP